MPNRVKRIGKRIKELSKNPGYVITQGAKFGNSMYDTLPMEVAMKKGGKIRKKKLQEPRGKPPKENKRMLRGPEPKIIKKKGGKI